MPKRHAYGAIHDRVDDRDLRFSTLRLSLQVLPSAIDWRPAANPIEDQGNLGSCTGFGCGRATELLHALNGVPLPSRSKLWLYWYERFLEHTVTEDSGAMIRDGMRVLKKLGCPPSTDWPYDEALYVEHPPSVPELADATVARISSFYRVHTVLEAKQALALRHPVTIGFQVFDSFEGVQAARTGVIPVPDINRENFLGGHCMCLLGYQDIPNPTDCPAEHFIAANSWGTGWGAKGYCFLPYALFNRTLDVVSDLWVPRL